VTTLHPLKRLRYDAGLSRKRLAELAGVSDVAVWRIETGQTLQPTAETLAALADVLSKRLDVTVLPSSLLVTVATVPEEAA
jgi:transcriptional regulator with XRE-family HTH domain